MICCWVSGNYYETKQVWESIIKDLGGDVNMVTLDCGYVTTADTSMSTASDVIRVLKTKDILDSRPRIVRLKGVPDDYKMLEDYLGYCDTNNILAVDGPVGYRQKPPSQRWVSLSNTKFFKAIKSKGKHFNSPVDVTKKYDAVEWLSRVVKGESIDVDKGVLELLVGYKGKNLDILYFELMKLVDYANGETVTTECVKECCQPSVSQDVWQLIDSLDYGDFDSAISNLYNFYETAGLDSGSTFYGDLLSLFGALHQHYLFLVLIKDGMVNNKITPSAALETVSELRKKKRLPDGTYEFKDCLFSKNFVTFNMGKKTTRFMLARKKSMLYSYLLALYWCEDACRQYSGRHVFAKAFLNYFVMYVCGKITFKQMKTLLYNKEGEYV